VVPLGLDLGPLAAASLRGDGLLREAGFPPDAVVCGYVGRLAPRCGRRAAAAADLDSMTDE
jgi:hypothetical protein